MSHRIASSAILAGFLTLGAAVLALPNATLMAQTQCTTYTTDADFDRGVLQGVNHNAPNNDQLQLSPTATTFPFAWIANADEGTVSKVDTRTGKELARYRTGPNGAADSPSRTAVDSYGNCWVANRAFNTQASVTEILIDGGIDRNGNSTIETSTDTNNNGVIDPGEILPWGADERVARHYLVGSPRGAARALTLDRNGFIWVGLFYEYRVVKLDPSLDSLVYAPLAAARPPELVSVPTAQTYGLALGPNNRLYLATLASVVQEIDPGAASGGTDPPRVLQTVGHSGTNYGIAVDRSGIVWLADLASARCIRWDPTLGPAGISYGINAAGRGRGITVDFDGNIWMACDLVNMVAKFAPTNPPTLICNAPAGGAIGPIGVGVAADGHIIAVGQSSNSWGKINKDDCSTILTGGPQTVGRGPYTYSDFTGSLRQILGREGFWTVITDGGAPGTEWGTVSWNSLEPESTSVGVEVRAADDVAALETKTYMTIANGVGFCPLPGRYLQVRARLATDRSDLGSPILYDLTVCPCNQNPICDHAVASAPTLWPPNHAYHAISILGVTDPDGDPVTITVTGITQDEPLNTRGDGNTCPDGLIVDGQASVRAERSGTPGTPGNGRVYAISFTASDGRGGECRGTVSVCVPHDVGDQSACVDDGQKYNSLGPCSGGQTLAAEVSDYGLTVAQVIGSETTIEFSLPQEGNVQVAVFDVAGRRVATLEDGLLASGVHQRTWDMNGVAKGLYFVRLKAGAATITKTVIKTS